MNELITTLTNATPEQYFFALVLFGVERKMVPEAGIEPARQQ